MKPAAAKTIAQALGTAVATFGVALLAACGGGGGGGGGPMPTATPVVPPPSGPAGAGLVSEIVAASVSDDPAGQVQVTFTLTDADGVPLTATLASAESDQEARVRLTLARLEEYSGGGDLPNTFLRYVNQVNDTRPAFDRNGTLELIDAREGLYRYTFTTQVADFDPEATYAVGMQVDREFGGVEESANPVFDFVPAGRTPLVREDVTTAQCNQCHAPLIAHGNRREVRLCTLCHTAAAVDEMGRSVDFRHMIHMIHAGKELPSIVNGPPGANYAIFSSFQGEDVVFAEKQADGTITGVGFPRPLEECLTCHATGATAEFYRTKPSTPACATCHDDVNPSPQPTDAGPPGTNHSPGAYADGQCYACHGAEMTSEFDISVPGAHVVPEQSTQLAGLNLSILDVQDAGAGQTPTVLFGVTDNAGDPLRDLSGLNRLGFALAGPTTDYARVLTPTAVGGGSSGTLVGPDAQGIFSYTLPMPIPADAMGTWSLGAEARRSVQLTESISVNEAAVNPVVSFPVDGSGTMQRRTVVENQRCFTCHGDFSKGFSIHGGLRNRTEYCVLCHNPNATDAARRRNDPEAVMSASPTATINFRVLIHKIHRGEHLEQQPYVVYGFGPSPPGFTKHDFGEVLFPGDLRDCETCHFEGTAFIPPYPGMALGTLVAHLDPANGDEVDDGLVAPITSVCTACHDGADALAHAEAETASGGAESCEVCHGEGRDFAVSRLHAGRN
jgi:OmcA/MtrC family decaheme c-type cytochrome